MHPFAERWKFALPPGVSFFKIWPPSRYSIAWPGGAIDDGGADYIASAAMD
jgi:hypothetical protein